MTEKGFSILFEAYFEEIRRYVFFRSGDAELSTDVAQETFMKIWEKQYNLEPGSDVALLYKIAGDLLISHFRRERLSRKVQSEMNLELQGDDHEHDIYYRELRDRYKKALMKLPEKQRVVFLMSRLGRFSYREIAERLDISIKAVEKRMNLALKFLRMELNIA
ncbi:MAG: sigma-70 family RNA polymerase sigma factor [Bacteroidota bacterium]